jgi:hypothetical protein
MIRVRRNVAGTAALVIAALAVAALGASAWLTLGTSEPALREVRGSLLEVQSSSLVFADRVVLRDAEGRTWSFVVDPDVATNREEPQSAAHLRVHLSLADPVVVRYRETPDGPVAVRIVDAE